MWFIDCVWINTWLLGNSHLLLSLSVLKHLLDNWMSNIAKWKSRVSNWYSDVTNNQTHSTEKLANHVGSRFYHGSFFLLWTPQTTHRPIFIGMSGPRHCNSTSLACFYMLVRYSCFRFYAGIVHRNTVLLLSETHETRTIVSREPCNV